MILMLRQIWGMALTGPLTPTVAVVRALSAQSSRAAVISQELETDETLTEKERARETKDLEMQLLLVSSADAPDAPIFMEVERQNALFIRLSIDVMLILGCLVMTGLISM